MGAGANATNALPDSVKGDTIAATKLLGPQNQKLLPLQHLMQVTTSMCAPFGHFAMMRGVMKVK